MLDKDATDALLKQIELCWRIMQYTDIKNESLVKELKEKFDISKHEDSLIYGYLSISFKTHAASMALIAAIFENMDKLAKKEDIKDIKSELSKKVTETLTPIAEEFKRIKEAETKGSDIYQ